MSTGNTKAKTNKMKLNQLFEAKLASTPNKGFAVAFKEGDDIEAAVGPFNTLDDAWSFATAYMKQRGIDMNDDINWGHEKFEVVKWESPHQALRRGTQTRLQRLQRLNIND